MSNDEYADAIKYLAQRVPMSHVINCRQCGACWDIDRDPESCTCANDAGWELEVVPTSRIRYLK